MTTEQYIPEYAWYRIFTDAKRSIFCRARGAKDLMERVALLLLQEGEIIDSVWLQIPEEVYESFVGVSQEELDKRL